MRQGLDRVSSTYRVAILVLMEVVAHECLPSSTTASGSGESTSSCQPHGRLVVRVRVLGNNFTLTEVVSCQGSLLVHGG
jgi:hypothetical protein